MRGIKNRGKLKKGLITSFLKSEISNAEYNYIKYFNNDNGSNNNVSNNTDASTNTNASDVSNNTNVSNNSNVSNNNTDDDT